MIGASDLPRVNLDFTEQPPIPEAGIRRAGELMASGRLFRYGETGAAGSDVAGLEDDFAPWSGAASAWRSTVAAPRWPLP